MVQSLKNGRFVEENDAWRKISVVRRRIHGFVGGIKALYCPRLYVSQFLCFKCREETGSNANALLLKRHWISSDDRISASEYQGNARGGCDSKGTFMDVD